MKCFLRISGGSAEVDASEHPDFILSGPDGRTGLEVTQVFHRTDDHGSASKREERARARWLKTLARDYYKAGGQPVLVKVALVAQLEKVSMAGLVESILIARQMMATLEQKQLTPDVDGGLTVYLTPLPKEFVDYSRWISITDSVGWVHTLQTELLQDTIRSKAAKLASYRLSVARVSLLIVADRLVNSGRFQLASDTSILDACGFEEVNLLTYPESVHRIG